MTGKAPNNAYTTRLLKGGALLDDMRLLVRSWKPDGSLDKKNQRVILENALAKKTKSRASDVYQEVFSQRFLRGDPPNAWEIVRPLEDRDATVEILKPVYYWIASRADRLIYDFVTDELLQRRKSHDLSISVDHTVRWIAENLERQGRAWTETVTLNVARALLAALRDFGILEGASKKQIAPIYLPLESFAYLAFNLYELGSPGESLINHPDWGLFLINPSAVEHLFLEAHQGRLLRYEAAGRLFRIEFFAENREEMADAVTGKRI